MNWLTNGTVLISKIVTNWSDRNMFKKQLEISNIYQERSKTRKFLVMHGPERYFDPLTYTGYFEMAQKSSKEAWQHEIYTRGVRWNASKSMWRIYFPRGRICIFSQLDQNHPVTGLFQHTKVDQNTYSIWSWRSSKGKLRFEEHVPKGEVRTGVMFSYGTVFFFVSLVVTGRDQLTRAWWGVLG